MSEDNKTSLQTSPLDSLVESDFRNDSVAGTNVRSPYGREDKFASPTSHFYPESNRNESSVIPRIKNSPATDPDVKRDPMIGYM